MSNAVENSNGIFTSERGNPTEHLEDYQFKVREEPMFTKSGLAIPKKRVIVRDDNDKILGVVGGNYKVLTHADALDPVLNYLKRKNIKTFKRVALSNDGARMFASIYLPDQEMQIGNPITGNRRDTCWPGFTVVNSLDGILKLHYEETIFRLACTNGMRVPVVLATDKVSHTKGRNFEQTIDSFLDRIGNVEHLMTFQKWANNVMEPEKMEKFADKIVKDKSCKFPATYIDLVKKEIAKEASFGVVSVWGLYNAFNSVLEHNLLREKGKINRARMLDANLYNVFDKMFK